jgi:hypothetical protein
VGPIGWIGFGAVGLLVVLWLVISFSEPSRRRDVLEWLAATCLFVALSMLFLNLVRGAHGTLALLAFGFLGLLFGSGSIVSLVNTLRSLRSPRKAEGSTTN